MGSQADQAIAELDATLAEVNRAARALPADALRYAPGGDEWPIDWILRHIGTGVRYRVDLELARSEGRIDPSLFGRYHEIVKSATGRDVESILNDVAGDFRALQDQLRGRSDESLAERFTITMPSGRQLEVAAADGSASAANHTREHLAQIEDWLARRAQPA
ncbi:MAG: DinB family protein [Dehalococcoidia bacterium]